MKPTRKTRENFLLSAFTGGASSLWAVDGLMTGPLCTGGTPVAEYRQAKAAWEEAKLTYKGGPT